MRKTTVVGLSLLYLMLYPASPHANETLYEMSISRGMAAMNDLNYLMAIKEFESALKEKPADPQATLYLGASYNRLGRHEKAISLLTDLLKEHPDSTDAKEELGIAYYYQGNYPDAMKLLESVRTEKPEDAECVYYIGLSWIGIGELRKADEAFREAVRLDPSYRVHHHYRMGLAHLERKNTAEALNEFSQAYQAAPESEVGLEAGDLARLLSQKRAAPHLGMQVETRYEYDSNVVLNPYDSSVIDITPQDDFRFATTGIVTFTLPVGDLMTFNTRARFIESVHNHIGDFNLTGNDLSTGLNFNLPWISPFVGYEYEYYFLDDCKQSYLRSNSVSPGFTLPETWFTFTQTYYRFEVDDFLLPFEFKQDNRTARNHTVAIDQYFFLSRDARRWVRTGVDYERNNAYGFNYVYNGLKVYGELFTPLVCDVTLDFIGEYYMKDYFKSEYNRYDEQQNYVVTVNRQLNKYLGVALQYELVVNGSTVALFEYGRDIFSLVGTISF